ncbi:hypothetical protein KPH14_003763 [Odynerus spinipes]|uniref:Uncharacterized protein n=1 Tax=Odynerus spinipes TaxID=1348599 RepID=A0AAD9RX94_9HYME|nr:hypothetical protein KPH14_003763 [Odynerus spinipes]
MNKAKLCDRASHPSRQENLQKFAGPANARGYGPPMRTGYCRVCRSSRYYPEPRCFGVKGHETRLRGGSREEQDRQVAVKDTTKGFDLSLPPLTQYRYISNILPGRQGVWDLDGGLLLAYRSYYEAVLVQNVRRFVFSS